ncbi:MAG: hypothetical protein KA007_01030 [Candidatus Pacebacteria bacterium]|jgi:hypothetical protein|nr:hypothetical protein [Candidatus Paceibacterota bacterium]
MKKSLFFIVLISLVGVAVFGSFTMVHGANEMSMNCLVSVVEGAGCPVLEGLLNSTVSHLSSFKGFSLGVLSFNFLNFFGVVMLMVLLVDLFFPFRRSFLLNRGFFSFLPIQSGRHLSWLSLHESSPNL